MVWSNISYQYRKRNQWINYKLSCLYSLSTNALQKEINPIRYFDKDILLLACHKCWQRMEWEFGLSHLLSILTRAFHIKHISICLYLSFVWIPRKRENGIYISIKEERKRRKGRVTTYLHSNFPHQIPHSQ